MTKKENTLAIFLLAIVLYSLIGTGSRVDQIKAIAPKEIKERGWEIIRYEGYQYGSWSYHGGRVWYYVKDENHKNTYYKVFLTLWGDELHYHYKEPEKLHRINIDDKQ